MELRRLVVVCLLMMSAACTDGTTSGATDPPTSTSSSGDAIAGDDIEGDIVLDALGEGLADAGIDRYRFRSTMTIEGSPSGTAEYEGRVSLASSHVVAHGIVGDFEVYLSEDGSYFRYSGHDWEQVPADQVWQWPSNGPIPDYATAGTIARLALDLGVEDRTEAVLDGVDVIHTTSATDDDLQVDLWIAPTGVVRKVILVEVDVTGDVTTEWTMYDVNGDFVIDPPRLDAVGTDGGERSRDRATPQPD